MNSIPLNDLSRISESEVSLLTELFMEICKSGNYLKGAYTRAFESDISGLFDSRFVVAVANGTDALTLAVAALQLPSSAKVAVVPNAGGYATTAVQRLGLCTTYIDVEIDTAQMDPQSLRTSLVADSTIAAVVVTHLFGLCGRIEEIVEVCEEFQVPLIEDCAQSIGARVDSKPVGTFGSIATLSFYPTKNLGGMGDGGAVVCSSYEQAKLVAQIAQYGWSERYKIEILHGFNSRIDEIQAAFLSTKIAQLEENNQRRRDIINEYSLSLSGQRSILFENSSRCVGHLAIMNTPTRVSDTEYLEHHGVSTGIHYPILDYKQPAWSNSGGTFLPNAEELCGRILTLPCFPGMTDEEVKHVASILSQMP
jgi:dTDP-3-amino-2,3,6-trideoxy-4-keto-D-glucose/dTDP-3-amino-3,4,6-trideoxy-alpha-D-glucose/dTDP-2,6-dideoxy-D-kanosamine transaminase